MRKGLPISCSRVTGGREFIGMAAVTLIRVMVIDDRTLALPIIYIYYSIHYTPLTLYYIGIDTEQERSVSLKVKMKDRNWFIGTVYY